jgi:Archaeal fructose-1,6-bisphosphatase and related enzymes of inositol monophosphatase family
MVDVGMNLWDVAAIPPIIHESGGRFTDWTGSPGITTTAVATNGPLHDEILRLLRK